MHHRPSTADTGASFTSSSTAASPSPRRVSRRRPPSETSLSASQETTRDAIETYQQFISPHTSSSFLWNVKGFLFLRCHTLRAKEDLEEFSLNIWEGRRQRGSYQEAEAEDSAGEDGYDGDIKFIVTTSSTSPNQSSVGDRVSSSPRTFGIGPL